jgi:hypothetical protein
MTTALTNALNEIMGWLQENSPDCASQFQLGLPLEMIEEKLAQLPFRVSEEVYELYQWRNGNPYCGVFVYHRLLELDEALEVSQGINDAYWLEVRTEDGDPTYLLPVFDFDGEYFAVPGSDTLTQTTPIFHIGCDDGSVSLAFTSLTNMMLAIAECYQTGVYSVTDGYVTVTDETRFGEIRRKHNPETTESLYAGGW